MAEIVSSMKKHDVGGFVILNSPTHAEFKFRLDEPSWSCLQKLEDKSGKFKGWNFQLRKAHPEKNEATLSMVSSCAEIGVMLCRSMQQILERMKQVADFDYERGDIDRGPEYE